jgi:hypothetical protein
MAAIESSAPAPARPHAPLPAVTTSPFDAPLAAPAARRAGDAAPARPARLAAAAEAVPAALAVFVILWLAADGAGFDLVRWTPAALAMAGLVAVAAVALPVRPAELPRAVWAALGALGAYTAWSYASILWAEDPGTAWDGSNRTLLYLCAFALPALWAPRGRAAGAVVALWALGTAALAVVVALRLSADPGGMFVDDRLADPARYPNAAAAQWLMAFWPAVILAAAPRVPAALRGLLAGGAVVLAGVALLSLSRGSLLAMPAAGLLLLALAPGRVRMLAVLAPVAGAVAAAAPAILEVSAGAADGGAVDAATRAVLGGAVVVAVLVAGVAATGARMATPARRAAAHRAGALAAVVVLGSGAVAGTVALGDPAERARAAWASFQAGYAEVPTGASRLGAGLGSNRHDFYRAALDVWREHPVGGIGADGFRYAYLRHGRSAETPSYPHSVELRALVGTGLVGATLLLAFLAAAAVAARRAVRTGGAAAVPVAAGSAFLLWLLHGSVDWFWEIAGLGAPAFLMLGLACGTARRRRPGEGSPPPRRRGAVALLAWGLAAALVAPPWLAEREVRAAGQDLAADPARALARLDRAARLDPLADRPLVVRGAARVRLGDLTGADGDFAAALARTPATPYPALQRATIASWRGDGPRARRLAAEAVERAPRDQLARRVAHLIGRGVRVDPRDVDREVLRQARAFTG